MFCLCFILTNSKQAELLPNQICCQSETDLHHRWYGSHQLKLFCMQIAFTRLFRCWTHFCSGCVCQG